MTIRSYSLIYIFDFRITDTFTCYPAQGKVDTIGGAGHPHGLLRGYAQQQPMLTPTQLITIEL